MGPAMTSEGIFFTPRDDTGIIAFALVIYQVASSISKNSYLMDDYFFITEKKCL